MSANATLLTVPRAIRASSFRGLILRTVADALDAWSGVPAPAGRASPPRRAGEELDGLGDHLDLVADLPAVSVPVRAHAP